MGDDPDESGRRQRGQADGLGAGHGLSQRVLRRSVLAGEISADVAALAQDDLLQLRVELFPYTVCASRVWELRPNLTAYDAWYVALAENLGAPLATLDTRLSRASGTRCEFALPPV